MPVEEIFEPMLYVMCFLISLAFYNVFWALAIPPLLFAIWWFIFGPRVGGGFCGTVAYQSRWEELKGKKWTASMNRRGF